MDQDEVLIWVQKLSLLVPPSLFFSLSSSFSLLFLLQMTDGCSILLRLILPHFRAKIDFSRQNFLLCSHCHTAAEVYNRFIRRFPVRFFKISVEGFQIFQ